MRATVFLSLLFISFAIFTVSYLGYPSNYSIENQAAVAQLSNNGTQEPTNSSQQLATQELTKTMGVKIDYPIANQEVPVGKLNISGSSTDTASDDCSVFVDVNDIKPFQNTTATGPGGQSDYSNWTFTYTEKYKLITEGNNELTAKLTCNGNDIINSNGTSNIANEKSKWFSINITGIAVQAPIEKTQNQTQNQTQPSSGAQAQKIAILDDKELSTPSQEDAKSINDVAPEIESSTEDNEVPPEIESSTEVTEDESEILDNFNPSSELTEEDVYNAETISPSEPITEDTFASNDDLAGGEEPEGINPQPTQIFDLPNEDQVGTQQTDGEGDFNDIESENEESLSIHDGQQSQLRADQEERTESPLQMFELPNEDQVGNQLTDNEEDFNEIESENEDSLSLQDDVQMEFQPPIQFFDSDNQEPGTEEDEQQVIERDDNEIQSSEETYSMMTGNSNEGDDIGDMGESGEDGLEENSEDVISKEIPLVQSYNEDVR
ncbi:MAG TPA: hypothetical protein VLR10_04090, partial [Nitrososphaeraceae archaeon]|nr:hypothetical protein [Nitrososphaeraceae archaeon]